MDWTATYALFVAVAVLTIVALIDAYAVHQCLTLARQQLPDLCGTKHLLITGFEIAGMAVGLYGAARLMRAKGASP